MECIERKSLLEDIHETVLFSVREGTKLPTSEMRGARKVIDRIKSAPVVDVVEVRHGEWEYGKWEQGHWVKGNERCRCSVCHRDFAVDNLNIWYGCPHCLAKMDGKGDTE